MMFNDGGVFPGVKGRPQRPPDPPAPTSEPWIPLAPGSRAGCSLRLSLSPSNLSGVCPEEKVSSGLSLNPRTRPTNSREEVRTAF